jgi:hypothetical protein
MAGLDELLRDGFWKQPTVDESQEMYERAQDRIHWFINTMVYVHLKKYIS